jgi:hypothetical protein
MERIGKDSACLFWLRHSGNGENPGCTSEEILIPEPEMHGGFRVDILRSETYLRVRKKY